MDLTGTLIKLAIEPSFVLFEVALATLVVAVYYWFVCFMIYIAWDVIHPDSLQSVKQWFKSKLFNFKKKSIKKG